jgi:4,5-dihydroxyphthalate decarboxylase
MKFALLSRPRTQAVFDGGVKFAGLPIDWHAVTAPLNWVFSPDKPGGGILSGGFDGGEMSISSFVQARSRGAPLLALPVFLKCGLVQRSLYCATDSPLGSPQDLRGRGVGLVGYTSSMAIWVRGVLAEEYDVPRSSVAWHALTSSSRPTKVSPATLEIPGDFTADKIEAWEELDGYAHALDRPECFLLSLLERRELDAVVSFHAKIAYPKIRQLFRTEDEIWSHFQKTGVYPINHVFVLRKELLTKFPDIGEVLSEGLRHARNLWGDYLPSGERLAAENKMSRLGQDPFAYRLTDTERRSLEKFIDYLDEEGLIPEKIACDDLFH